MSNNIFITINDFENICRTCLSRQDLEPLYEKCFRSTCLVEMLMACTFIKFTEDDGLPVNICSNCINEINQAFSFAKRCKTTDIILRKCVEMNKTELPNNSSQSQNVEAKFLIDYQYVQEVKQEEDVNLEFEQYVIEEECKIEIEEYVQEIKEEADVEIENKDDKIYDNPADDSYKQDVGESQDINHSVPPSKIKPEPPHYECKKCFEKFSDCKGLKKHQKHMHHQTNAPCTRNRARNEETLSKSDKLTLGIHTCKICSKVFTLIGQLKYHMRIHNGKKPYTCGVCKKIFNISGNLNRHMTMHTGREKSHTCGICSKAFFCKTKLKRHMKMHTGEKPYTCEVCNKTFRENTNLKQHMTLHTGEKPHICRVCKKSFANRANANRHIRLHTERKLHTCGVCNNKLTSGSSLNKHMKIHSGEKPHICKVCSMSFIDNVHLKRHMTRHANGKPTFCSLCSQTFSNKMGLNNHMRIHTGKKPHVCSICSEAFSRSKGLKKHMGIHKRANKPYGCEICDIRFSRESNLNTHKRKFHEETY